MSRIQSLLNRTRVSANARDIATRAFLALFAWMWVLQILIPWWEVWRDESSMVVRFTVSALVLFFIGVYSFIMLRLYFWRRSWAEIFTGRERWSLRALTAGPGVILLLWQGDGFALTLAFTVLAAILTSPPHLAYMTAIYGTAIIAAVMGVAGVEGLVLISVLTITFAFGLLISSQLRQSGQIGELIEARYTEARMAAAEERLRIARDLHDVLGHSLSLITLKSELASALAEKDPIRAQREMREVESLARSAMNDVRRTVAAERRPTLSTELADARHLLDAAGISLEIEGSTVDFPEEVAALFAWGVREGVTNVVRHSRARHCTISLTREGDRAMLTVADDGAGPGAAGTRPGSGIAGLSDRADRLGGTVRFETLPGHTGHALTVIVPPRE
jgi:two-component system sensor histidine kinase DesK